MPQVPFPHILTYPSNNSFPPRGPLVRIVDPNIEPGFRFSTSVFMGKDIQHATFEVSEIVTKRKARGDWSAWNEKPNYYECKVLQLPPQD